MLVLTRKIDEEIQIGDGIRIKVLGIRGGSVRIGIEAPTSVKILRKELQSTGDTADLGDCCPTADFQVTTKVPVQSTPARTRLSSEKQSSRLRGSLAPSMRHKVTHVLGALAAVRTANVRV